MPLLTELAGRQLGVGDILRLPYNFDMDLGVEPVDLLVYEPYSDLGLGLMVTSGHKAGLTYAIFPRESCGAAGGLSVDWLMRNWGEWFVHTCSGAPKVIPLEEAGILDWAHRELVSDGDEDFDRLVEASVDFATDPRYLPGVKLLLSRDPGRFCLLREIAPDFHIDSGNFRIGWMNLAEGEWKIAIVMMDAETLGTHTTMHTDAFLNRIV